MGSGKLEAALKLAEAGFYVFRLQRNGKKPFAIGWQEEATRDPNEIHALFLGKDFNIGIFTEFYKDTESLVVVDVDTKDGKKGADTMAEHEAYGNDFPCTWEATTASGGRHLFYRTPIAYSGGANKLGLHVDVKSYGGYAVGAGSMIDGKEYRWLDSDSNKPDPETCPDWIIARLNKPLPKSQLEDAIDTLDTPDIIERAEAYLKTAMPAIAGAGGNETTLKTALKLKDYGVSQATAEILMWEFYNLRCTPPWNWDELLPIIANAYRYGKLAAGVSAPAADFDPVNPGDIPTTTEKPTKQRIFFERFGEIVPDFTNRNLIKDLLDPEAMSVLYGESNTGKTFVAMDIAWHIATGTAYDGRATQQGPVLYIAAEAGRSSRKRVLALKKRLGGDNTTPFFLVPCPINLFDSADDIQSLYDLIDEIDLPFSLIVIDTLSRALSGGNENDSKDMGKFVKRIDRIRARTKAHLMIVHHSGKDTAKGARGHSLLRAATDTELEVADNLITAKKQRDMEFSTPIGFKLDVVELGFDAYNEKVTSCVVQKIEASKVQALKARKEKIEPRDLVALEALRNLETGRSYGDFSNVASTKQWAQACKDSNVNIVTGAKDWPVTSNSFTVAFKRTRDRLSVFELVIEVDKDQWAIVK